MDRFTVSVSKEFKAKLDKFPDINWSKVMIDGIEKRLKILEKLRVEGKI